MTDVDRSADGAADGTADRPVDRPADGTADGTTDLSTDQPTDRSTRIVDEVLGGSEEYRCHRCNSPLAADHWVDRSTSHQGPRADGFRDVHRPFCPDCTAAVGLLELAIERQP